MQNGQKLNAGNKVLEKFKQEISNEEWNRYIKHLKYDNKASRSDIAQFYAPNILVSKWIKTKYSKKMEHIFELENNTKPKIIISIASNQIENNKLNKRTQTESKREGKSTILNPSFTFESFIIGSSNQFAYTTAKSVAEKPGELYNPLFIYGGVGLGKTHLIQAIGNYQISKGKKVIYTTFEQFMNKFTSHLRSQTMDRFREHFRECDILIIDDIQFLSKKEQTQEEFFHTFNELHNANKQIVLAADKTPKQIVGLEDRLKSRFEWGLQADIQATELETKIAIIQKKCQLDKVSLGQDIINYIATTISTNTREIEGMLTRLHAQASMMNTEITLDFTKDVLKEQIQEEKEEIESGYFEDLSNRLIACLKDFGIEGELLNIKPGPVVTMFEFRPAPGIKISRIAQLNSDLALAMKAIAVRIEAPIPGKDYIGIEIPNKKRKVVYFREIVESEVFKKHKGGLPIILGKDIQGNPRVEDLSKMPHLLVAGATGAGKSVCLNSIIISLLIRFSPEEVKFLLIDPKRIEMASYAGLPHLIHPVVTEMELAKTSLEWAVFEMEQRYDLMAKVGVRNISAYNEKVKKGELEEMQVSPMPYLVLIIDEMADLMLTVGKEAEAYIIRLAQLARAAGIHLILATQRPSVDVVTGLIKANFPARIGFQVTSKHDSRTILDTVGAENLLGKGDMLFKPAAGRIQRLHGAYISDGEINRVIEFWRKKFPEQQHLDFKEWKMEKEEDNSSAVGDGVCDDPMYKDAVKFVMEQGKVSISMPQRYLRIGFNRAARFVEQMEKDGIIGPQEGSKPRIVLKK